ncbi:MAG: LamG-like jellyroll fold domain-containing protein [Lentisphaeria bacterium]|jgi:hypothetical protein|nr:LamG-like jellyroll fold domain-containing protein [Lentisphaeria bacterium]
MAKPARLCFLLVLLGTLVLADWTEGLVYYHGFEDSLTPTVAGGSRAVEGDAEFAPGRVGQGARVGTRSLSMNHPGNYDPRQGTVAFWVQPAWSGTETREEGGVRSFFRGGWVALNYEINKGICFFMTGDVEPPDGFRWDYGQTTQAMRDWQPGEWHHLAIVWNAATKRKAIYVDGKADFDGVGEILSQRQFDQLAVTLGSALAGGVYDEWAIWDRELTADELAKVHADPAGLVQAARALPPPAHAVLCPLEFPLPLWDPPVAAILAPGTDFIAQIPVKNRSAQPFRAELRADLVDVRDHVLHSATLGVELAAGETIAFPLSFPAPPALGIFKVALTIPSENGKSWVRDAASFAVWPEPTAPPRRDSFFGNHVNSWYDGKMLDQAARLGLGWMRGHDMLQATWWNRVQPEPGQPQWQMENTLEDCFQRNMPVLGCLTGTPYWALKGGPGKPTKASRGYTQTPDPYYWSDYVRMTVERHRDRIRHWEIWNEPEVSMFFSGTPQEHAELVRLAVAEIRRIDPDIFVMAAGYVTPAWRWHEATAKAGAWRDLDAISLHYGCPDLPPEENEHKLREILAHFRGLLEAYGPRRDLPIWSTEGGTGDTVWLRGIEQPQLPPEHLRPPINAWHGAKRTVQGTAILMANGIAKHFYYFQNPIRSGRQVYLNTSMFDYNLAPRPKLLARVAMEWELAGARWTGEVRRPEDGRFWAHLFAREDGGTTVLWWAGDGAELAVETAWTTATAVDLMGNASPLPSSFLLTDEPAYVRLADGIEAARTVLEQATITVRRAPSPLSVQLMAEEKPDLPPQPDFVAPGENPAGVFTVDLRQACNLGFADIRNLPAGRQTLAGVPFQIIDPASNAGKALVAPRDGEPIRIPLAEPRNLRCLYFLHTALGEESGDIGSYVVHYADGTTATIANHIPTTNNDWRRGHHPEEQSRPIPIRTTAPPAWRYLRILEWENPKRDIPVTAIEVRSAGPKTIPVLVALTGV